jgi:hypothetical protein
MILREGKGDSSCVVRNLQLLMPLFWGIFIFTNTEMKTFTNTSNIPTYALKQVNDTAEQYNYQFVLQPSGWLMIWIITK